MRSVLIGGLLAVLAGCISPYKIPGTTDQYIKTEASEIRSPFGSNGGFDIVEQCTGPDKVVLFYFSGDFEPCAPLVVTNGVVYPTICQGASCRTVPITLSHKYSQGQGGQIASGFMNAAALGGVAAVAGSAGNAVSSASTTVINNVPRGHHK